MAELFVVGTGEYEHYSVVAVFSTRELAEAWVAAANAQCVANAGIPGLSCQTPEDAARSYWIEEQTLDLDPVHPAVESVEEQFIRHYGSRANYNVWIAGGPYYRDENGQFRNAGPTLSERGSPNEDET